MKYLSSLAIVICVMLSGCDSARDVAQSAQNETASGGAADARPMAGNTTLRASVEPASGSDVSGTLTLDQQSSFLHITGSLSGLEPGLHGFHLHEKADCSAADASSAGGHFAPNGSPHGAPTQPATLHHAGDFGNIVANDQGVAQIDIAARGLTVAAGKSSVIGRAIVVHSAPDDLVSQPSGDAGSRVACGEIRDDSGR